MILARIEWILEYNTLYPDTMSGFRRGRCSADNILDLVTPAQQQKAFRGLCGAVFLDVKGTFDNVQHEAIMTALATT